MSTLTWLVISIVEWILSENRDELPVRYHPPSLNNASHPFITIAHLITLYDSFNKPVVGIVFKWKCRKMCYPFSPHVPSSVHHSQMEPHHPHPQEVQIRHSFAVFSSLPPYCHELVLLCSSHLAPSVLRLMARRRTDFSISAMASPTRKWNFQSQRIPLNVPPSTYTAS